MDPTDAKVTDTYARLEQRLNEFYTWPCTYPFKCIVPSEQFSALAGRFPVEGITTRTSSGGRFISMTMEIRATCAEDVLSLYRKAAEVEGVILL